MTTTTIAPAAPPVLDLDDRLALRGALMDQTLAVAAVAFEVNTAHIPAEPLPEITIPQLPQTAIPAPYTTPLAALLHRARLRIETDGWCRGARRDEQGARCLDGAIRAETPSSYAADNACTLLLEAIRRDFRDAETVPSWNDAQTSPRLPLLYLDRAAELANNRSI